MDNNTIDAKTTDIFISYRRVDGCNIARNIQLALKAEGFEQVFFDYTSMREGKFNEQIITAINHCKDFILVLSPQSMLRLGEPGDWVAREIEEAVNAGCKIIPVQIDNPFEGWPEDMPRKFNFIKQIQFLTLRTDEYFPDSIRRLISWLDSKPTLVTEQQKDRTVELTIHVDETCQLFLNEIFQRKVKGGHSATLPGLRRGDTYTLKLMSLAQKGSVEELTYICPEDGPDKEELTVSFAARRQQQRQQLELQRKQKAEAKEGARQSAGMLKQALLHYDTHDELEDGMVAVKLNDKVGFLNELSFEVVACLYDDASSFVCGFATVCKNGKWGIIDKIGQVRVPFHSDTPCWQHGDYAFFVSSSDGHYAIGTIAQGAPRLFPYDQVRIIAEHPHLFAVRRGQVWNIIDATGATSPFTLDVGKVSGTYNYTYRTFQNKWEDVKQCYTPLLVRDLHSDRWGFLNSQLQLTVPFVDEDSHEETNERNLYIIKTNGRMGLVDVETGRVILPTLYDNVHAFYFEDAFPFYRVAQGALCGSYKLDSNGNKVSEDTSLMWGGKQGVVNEEGQFVVPLHYQLVQIAHNFRDESHPYFVCCLLADLRLHWGEALLGTRYLRHEFDKALSEVHLYSSEGELLIKVSYEKYGDNWHKLIHAYWEKNP